ncbi:MAG: DUF5989 family protein [Kiritimatiellia bacterium]|nr:DUF5989 family protein [Kiritimatiellia bacterium]
MGRLLREIGRYALVHKAWWLVPVVLVLLLLGALVFLGQASAPAFIYTLF